MDSGTKLGSTERAGHNITTEPSLYHQLLCPSKTYLFLTIIYDSVCEKSGSNVPYRFIYGHHFSSLEDVFKVLQYSAKSCKFTIQHISVILI